MIIESKKKCKCVQCINDMIDCIVYVQCLYTWADDESHCSKCVVTTSYRSQIQSTSARMTTLETHITWSYCQIGLNSENQLY